LTIVAETNSTAASPWNASFALAASASYSVATNAAVTISLVTPVVLPAVTVAATSATATIGTSTNGVFTFSRTGATSAALTVNYTLSGTAVNGTDYTRLGTSVTIPAGASSATATVAALANSTGANPETVVLGLSASSAYNLGSPSSATVSITTPPAALPVVTVVASAPHASRVGLVEGAFTFTRTGSTTAALTVNYSLGGTATRLTDYRTLAGNMPLSITIPAGAKSVALRIEPVPSTSYVGTETIILTLSTNPSYTVGSPNSGTITLAGNAVPTSSITATSTNVTVTWASTAGKTYRVAYQSSTSGTVTNLSGLMTASSTTTSYIDTTANNTTQRTYVVYVTN
jgi:hypothetical protein